MPLYEYECTACGHRFERIQKFSDPPVEACPSCGEPRVQKLLSSPAIQFKGTGWYITDYARKGAAGTDAKGAASTDGSKESKESRESKESGESKESKESGESKESKESNAKKTTADSSASTSSSSAPSTPKASGE